MLRWGQDGAKMDQDGAMMVPRGVQDGPRWCQAGDRSQDDANLAAKDVRVRGAGTPRQRYSSRVVHIHEMCQDGLSWGRDGHKMG